MYENACKLMAKQKVALECLSYHATASQQQTIKLVQDTIQSAEDYCLYTFQFVGKIPFKISWFRLWKVKIEIFSAKISNYLTTIHVALQFECFCNAI